MAVLDISKSSDHRMLRCKLTPDLKRKREKLFRMKGPNIPMIKEKLSEVAIRIQNRYSQLVDKVNGYVESLNDNLTNVLLESVLEVGGKVPKKSS